MNDKQQNEEPLVHAYERMMERVRHVMEAADEKVRPTLEGAIEDARARAIELGEITREEAEQVGEYIRRDVQDLAEHLNESGAEMKSWLRLDLELIETAILERIASVADRTRVELAGLAVRAREAAFRHTGEVTAPGVLACTECGEKLHFHKAGRIPPCPRCRGGRFKRVRG